MGLAGRWRRTWWIAAVPVLAALQLFFTFVSPYLLSDVHPLRDRDLRAAARELARRERVGNVPVRVEDVHRFTSEPNAMAVGLGSSRRVILWDTLVSGRFTDRQVEVVIAHEFGHHARRHLWKGIAWFALLLVPAALIIEILTRRRGGMGAFAAVPLALLVVAALQLVAMPLNTAVTRRFEVEADWAALNATRDPSAARGLFRRLATTSLSEPTSPGWVYVVLDDHPTIMQRIAMADAWARREGRR
jgi:STE24 endopeptidase